LFDAGLFSFSGSPAGTYASLPVSELRDGDVQVVTASSRSDEEGQRGVFRYITTVADLTLTLLPASPSPNVRVTAVEPYLLLTANVPPGGDDFVYQLDYEGEGDLDPEWHVALSGGYIMAAGISSHTLPDLSAVFGFDASWGLDPAEIYVFWDAVTYESNRGSSDLLRTAQTPADLDGHEVRWVQRYGDVMP
jgi:hypothetical protein